MKACCLALIAAVAVAGCNKESPGNPAATRPPKIAPPSWYRAALQGPDGELVFLLGLPAPGSGGTAILQSGVDRVERAATWDGKGFHVEFPVYQTSLHGDLDSTGVLRGEYRLRSATWGSATLRLIATPIAKPETAALLTVASGAPIDLGASRTIWKVELAEQGLVRLTLDQLAPGEFHGTLVFPSGHHTYVAGNGRGGRIVLTSFNGAGPSRLTFALDPSGAAGTGEWLTGPSLDWRERFTATRVPELELTSIQPDARGTVMKLPQLADLAGKPVILELAGSWCSSCKNAAPVLRALHDEHAARGLAIVTLLYEFTDDDAAGREQAAIFQQAYGIPWRVEYVPGQPDQLATIMPPGFAEVGISGFPIALFLDQRHRVVGMHAGFPVAGSAEHADAVAAYRAETAKILGAR